MALRKGVIESLGHTTLNLVMNLSCQRRVAMWHVNCNTGVFTLQLVELIVTVKPSIRELNNITELEGRQVEINCHSRGDPLPTLVFNKDNHEPYRRGNNVRSCYMCTL